MSGRSHPSHVSIVLSRRDAAVIAAALRQYEPYFRPSDAESADRLAELAEDIRTLLDRLSALEPSRPTPFPKTKPDLHVVSRSDENETPT